MIEDGKFIPKWKHEYEMKNGSVDRVRELQNELRRNNDLISIQRERIEELEEKEMKYERTVRELHEEMDELSDTKLDVPEVKIIVNGTRYNIT